MSFFITLVNGTTDYFPVTCQSFCTELYKNCIISSYLTLRVTKKIQITSLKRCFPQCAANVETYINSCI